MSLDPLNLSAWGLDPRSNPLAGSPVPMGLTDAEGRILYANAAACAWGADQQSPAQGQSLASWFVQPALLQQHLQAVLAQSDPMEAVLSLHTALGQPRAVQVQFHRTRRLDGQAWGVFFVGRDLSDTALTSLALQAASQYARSLLEASLDPMVTISVEGKIMDVNQATEKATGLSRDALVGADFSNFFTEPDKARAGYRLVFSLGHVNDYPLALRHTSGRVTDVLYNASVYHDSEGRVAGVFAAARDITQLKRSREALESTNREVTLLAQMNSLLQSCTSVEEAVPIAVSAMRLLFEGVSGRFYLVRSNAPEMTEAAVWGDLPAGGGDLQAGDCWALRRGRVHDVGFDAVSLNPACHRIGTIGAPYLCLPLQAQGTVLGIVHLLFPAGSDDPSRLDRRRQLAVSAADSISLALANLRLRESLHALSIRDPLTGLYNRRFMEESLSRELSRVQRAHKPLAVAVMDLDHFKTFNDTHGHQAGDLALKAVSRLLLGFRQGSDVACRFGGEEFVLVLPEILRMHAVQRLQRFCHDVASLVIEHQGQTLPTITVSVGVAMFPRDGDSPEKLIHAADGALYRAKANGRNRVEFASPAED